MTAAEILTAVNSHISHQGEDSERLYLPDIFPFIDPALISLARRVAQSRELSNLLIASEEINVVS